VLGLSFIALMMLLMTADVTGRFLFNSPIFGTIEIIEVFLVIAVFASIAYCAMVKGNVAVDLLVRRFPQKGQDVTDIIIDVTSLAFLSVMAWASADRIEFAIKTMERSTTIDIPFWPFRIVSVIGIALLCIVLAREIVLRFINLFGGRAR